MSSDARTVDALAAIHGDVQVMPMSLGQRRFWMLDQLDAGSAVYTIPIALRLEGPLSPETFERALNVVIERHEALRTVFALEGDEPQQVVLPSSRAMVPVVDLSALSAEARDREIGARAEANLNAPFDLAVGPLLRAALLRISGTE